MKYKELILDADICIKMGRFHNEKLKFIQLIVPLIAEKAYMHKYVYEEEVLTPKNSKIQLDNLKMDGMLEILDEDSLDENERKSYDAAVEKLSGYMINPNNPGKNLGEVKTIAISSVKSIPYFMSDEGELQSIIDTHINKGIATDIKVFRMSDLINWIKLNKPIGIGRKEAKVLWIATVGTKEYFDNVLWPI